MVIMIIIVIIIIAVQRRRTKLSISLCCTTILNCEWVRTVGSPDKHVSSDAAILHDRRNTRHAAVRREGHASVVKYSIHCGIICKRLLYNNIIDYNKIYGGTCLR